MGLLDGLLGQIGQNVDVANLAQKIGLPPEMVTNAIAALAQAHAEPGDTVQQAAGATGLPTDKLAEIVQHIGGEGSLAGFASLLNQDGGTFGALGDIAGNFLGRK